MDMLFRVNISFFSIHNCSLEWSGQESEIMLNLDDVQWFEVTVIRDMFIFMFITVLSGTRKWVEIHVVQISDYFSLCCTLFPSLHFTSSLVREAREQDNLREPEHYSICLLVLCVPPQLNGTTCVLPAISQSTLETRKWGVLLHSCGCYLVFPSYFSLVLPEPLPLPEVPVVGY